MADASYQEKTERATPKKKEEARKRGQVAKSREATSTIVFLSLVILFYFWGPQLLKNLLRMMEGFLSHTTDMDVTVASLNLIMAQAVHQIALILAPVLIVAFGASILGNVMQFGFLMSGESLAVDLNRINPLTGFARLFSKNSLMELIKSIAKIGMIGYLAFRVVRREFVDFLPALVDLGMWEIFYYICRIGHQILVAVLWFLVVLALIDYVFQRWQYEEKLKMTKQEVKDEYKQREGDPQIKARVRIIQREMARKRMLTQVPTADVVVTNPTHVAVALKYEPEKAPSPRVVAKGADTLALKIREVARKHHVPIVEQKPLAQALYKGVKLDGLIPEQLYRAVAELLAYVYSLKGRPAGP